MATALVFVVLLCTLGPGAMSSPTGGKVSSSPPKGKDCAMPATRDQMMRCMTAAKSQADREKCTSAAAGSCAPDAKEVEAIRERAARASLAECLAQQPRSDCMKMYSNMTGRNASASSNPKKQENAERRMIQEGMRDVLGQSMRDCLNVTRDQQMACMRQAREQFENATDQLANRSKGLMDAAIKQAGKLMAGQLVRECIEKAATSADKRKCMASDDARQQAALASGRRPEDITEEELQQAAEDSASKDIADQMKTCVEQATTASEKRECAKQDSLREAVANARAKGADEIKDSHVRNFIERGAQDKALEAMKSCSKGQDKESISACREEARRIMAEASGKDNITDFDLERSKREAQRRDISRIMEDCMRNATTQEARKACRDVVEEAMREANPSGAAPSKRKVEQALKEAAMNAVKEHGDACVGDRNACFGSMKEKIAKSRGIDVDDLSDEEAKDFQRKGAVDAAKDAARACTEARKDNQTASCDNPYDEFIKIMGRAKSTDPRKQKVEERRLLQETAREAIAEARMVCLELPTKAEVDTCTQESKGDTDALFASLIGGGNITADKLNKRMERAEQEADKKAIGDMFRTCMKAATNQTEKDVCLQDMKAQRGKAGVTESAKAILQKSRARLVMEQGSACDGGNATEMSRCREHAKKEAIAMGMQPREFNAVKRLGETKAAAEVWAACNDAGESDVVCDAQAQEELMKIAGVSATDDVPDSVLARVRKLGKAMAEGEALVTIFKRAVDASVLTDGTECKPSIEDKMVSQTDSAANAANPAIGNVTKRPCRVVDGQAEYAVIIVANFTDADIDNVSAAVASNLQGQDLSTRRLSYTERRLATVSEAFASQVVEECPESDAACNSLEVESSQGTSSTSSSSSGGSSTSSGSSSTTGTSGTTGTSTGGSTIASSGNMAMPVASTLLLAVVCMMLQS